MTVRVWLTGICLLVLLAGAVQAVDTCAAMAMSDNKMNEVKPNLSDAATVKYIKDEIESMGGITRLFWTPKDFEEHAQKIINKSQGKEYDRQTQMEIATDYRIAVKKLCQDNAGGKNSKEISRLEVEMMNALPEDWHPWFGDKIYEDAIAKDPYNYNAYRSEMAYFQSNGQTEKVKEIERRMKDAQARQLDQEAGEFLPLSSLVAIAGILLVIIGFGLGKRKEEP
jgi:hypothetical protein